MLYFAMTGANAYTPCQQPICSRWNAVRTHLLRHLVDALLAREEDRRGEHALCELAADALVQALDSLFLEDREDAVERGLVPLGVCLAGLETVLHDAVVTVSFSCCSYSGSRVYLHVWIC